MKISRGKESPPATRSSHPEVFWQKCVFKNFAKPTWKQLCQILFVNKYAGLNVRWLLLSYRWLLRLQWLLNCFLLPALTLYNILLIHAWKELMKEVKMCIVSILHVFNIYFQWTYQHIHDKGWFGLSISSLEYLTRSISFTIFWCNFI